MQKAALSLVIALGAILVLAACDLQQDEEPETATTPAAATVTPAATVLPQETPGASLPITITESSTTLTIWIPPEAVTIIEGSDSAFSGRLSAIASTRPDLTLSVELKPVEGQGGILSYLRTARNVAPSVIPDLIALPADQLVVAADENLVFPLDALIDPAEFADLYPASLTLVNLDTETMGYPFMLTNLYHLAYNSNVITTTLPLTWNTLVSQTNGDFIFPASGEAGAVFALQFYLAEGGNIVNETGQPMLEIEPLTAALEKLGQGRNTNFITLQSSNISSLDDTWQHFQASSAAMAQVAADLYLRERSPELPAGFSPMPGPNGAVTPIVDGWVWAISSLNPVQRSLAAELLTALVAEPGYGVWSYQVSVLPARRQAFASWPPGDPYITFLQQELERAQPLTAAARTILPALGDAVFDVISLSVSPQEAAAAAVSAVAP